MDQLVKRVTIVRGSGDQREATVAYQEPKKYRNKTSPWLKPLERTVRRILKAEVIGTQDLYQRHLNAGDQGRDAWIMDAPKNILKSRRKAYREGRKVVPFGLLPKV